MHAALEYGRCFIMTTQRLQVESETEQLLSEPGSKGAGARFYRFDIASIDPQRVGL